MPPVDLDVTWNRGAPPGQRCNDPLIQVHRIDDATVVLRQSIAVNYEAPFLYLFFGESRAILFDTGATSEPHRFPLREVVDQLCDEWVSRHPQNDYELVVAHSHAHGDHVAADGQFADRPHTTLVGHSVAEVSEFFGLTFSPPGETEYQLGGRTLRLLAAPGHESSALAVWDAHTELLLTGDTVYPGRLYVRDMAAFESSLNRLVEFTRRHPISFVLGSHIEMSTHPRRDYPRGLNYHPHEARLPMSVQQLKAVRDAAATVAQRPGAHRFDDFAIFNGPCRWDMTLQMFRTALRRLWPF